MRLVPLDPDLAPVMAAVARGWATTMAGRTDPYALALRRQLPGIVAFADAISDTKRQHLGISVAGPDDGATLTTAEVAELLGCSARTVQRLRKAGRLRSVAVGRLRRFRPVDVAAYLAGQGDSPEIRNDDGEA